MKVDEVYAKLKKMIASVSVGIKNTESTKNPDGSVTITINFTSGSPLSFTMSPVKGDKGIGIKDALIKEIQNGENTEYHLILIDDKNNNIDAGKLPISPGSSIDLSNYTTKDNSIKSINLIDAIPTGSTSGNQEKCLQLVFADDTKIVNISVEDLVDTYNDTQVKSDIADLKSDKQDKTDNSLDTTDKTVVGAINEVNGNQLDTVTFSADYKNIILNRKSGLNPYTIPISSIIHNVNITDFNDVDSTNMGDGKTLVYDSSTKKHKYVDSTLTDELVKMDSTTDAKYLSELIDESTLVNNNGVLKVKKLDGQQVTITEINYLKGLTMNVMSLVNMFANGGVKIINTPVNTYADLLTYDKSSLIDNITYIIYVLADETHNNTKTTYLIDKTTSTPTFFGNADEHRDFTTDPIDLVNEVTGKLGVSNIDVDALWKLLTINDTYKTLTTKDEVFGTHGAKALYDELVTNIGKKANDTDLTAHTGDTNIHITTAERTKWNKVDNKVDKTSILTNISASPSDSNLLSEKLIKSELDKKSSIIELNNLRQGILVTPNSMNKNILLWNVGHYYFSGNDMWRTYEHIPNTTYAPHVYVSSVSPKRYENTNDEGPWFRQIKVDDHLGKSFIRTIYTPNVKNVVDLENGKMLSGDQCSDTGWQRICTTSVDDVPLTDIILNIPNILTTQTVSANYVVKNSYASINLVLCIKSSTSALPWIKVATGLPKAASLTHLVIPSEDGNSDGIVVFKITPNGELYLKISKIITKADWWSGNLIYPVAEQ